MMTADTTTRNKALLRRLFDEVDSQGHFGALDELLAPDFQIHTPGAPPMDRAGYRMLMEIFRTGFPDLVMSPVDQVAEGDRVATRLRIEGTHLGAFQGIPPSGRRIAISGINIARFDAGRVAELWGVPDLLGLLQQIGAVPAPAAG